MRKKDCQWLPALFYFLGRLAMATALIYVNGALDPTLCQPPEMPETHRVGSA